MLKNCEWCKRDFENNTNRKYCSRTCIGKANCSRSPSGKKSPAIEKICPVCDIIFSIPYTRRGQVYCSRDCFADVRKGKKHSSHKVKPTTKSICPSCGVVIRNCDKYCSRDCFYIARMGYWELKDDQVLFDEYENCIDLKLLATKLWKTKSQLQKRSKFWGLKRTEAVIEAACKTGGSENSGFATTREFQYRFWETGQPHPSLGKPMSDSQKIKLSIKGILRSKDPEYQRRRMDGLRNRVGKNRIWECPNRYERELNNILNDMYPGEYTFVGDWSLNVNGKNPDFVNSGNSKLIEVFGEVYHDPSSSPWGVPEYRTEYGRKKYFKEYGYDTLIVWCNEIVHCQKGGLDKLKEKVRRFHECESV